MELTGEIGETTNLWIFLEEAWSGSTMLNFPRFALFLLCALILEIICSRKRVNLLCTWSTEAILLAVGVVNRLAVYFIFATVFLGLVRIPLWYYPVTLTMVLIALLAFLKGAIALLREGLIANCAARSLLFFIAIYFAVATIAIPPRFNAGLTKDNPARIVRSHASARSYLDRYKHSNRRPCMKGFGTAEVQRYQNTVPELIKAKEKAERFHYSMYVDYINSGERFKLLSRINSNPAVASDEKNRTVKPECYIFADQSVNDAVKYYLYTQTKLDILTLEYMINDYEKQSQLIDTEWMERDLYPSISSRWLIYKPQ